MINQNFKTSIAAPVVAASAVVGLTFGGAYLASSMTDSHSTEASAVGSTQSGDSVPEVLHLDAVERAARLTLTGIDLGPASQVALDRDLHPQDRLRPNSKSAMVEFSSGQNRQWKVFTTASQGDVSEVSDSYCDQQTRLGFVQCNTARSGSKWILTTVSVAESAPQFGPGKFVAAGSAELANNSLKDLRVTKDVRIVFANGDVVSASETAIPPTTRDLSKIFRSSDAQLENIAENDLVKFRTPQK